MGEDDAPGRPYSPPVRKQLPAAPEEATRVKTGKFFAAKSEFFGQE